MNLKKILNKLIGRFNKKRDEQPEVIEEVVINETVEELILDKNESEIEDKSNKQEEMQEAKLEEDKVVLQYLSQIKTKIYYDKIDENLIEEINKSEILSEYQKTIILLAICEKENMLKRAKQIKAQTEFKNEKQKSEVNKIVERIKSNKIKRFDLSRYDKILHWEIDEELLEEDKHAEENQIEELNNDAKVNSHIITSAIGQGEYERALEIGQKFKDNAAIQSQMITVAIEKRNYEEAKKIGRKYENDPIIQSQMITIAIIEEEYGKALEIGERFEDNPIIQSQIVTINIMLEEYENARKIGKKFEYDEVIQSQMVTIAIKLGEYEKAREIAKMFKDNEFIQLQIAKIEEDEKQQYNGEIERVNKNQYLNEIKTKIYCDKIEDSFIEEINQTLILSEYEKTIILLAICEKKKMLKRANQVSSNYNPETKEQKVKINQILERIKSKKNKIFDLGKYDEILEWKFDFDLLEQYKKEKEQKEVTVQFKQQTKKTGAVQESKIHLVENNNSKQKQDEQPIKEKITEVKKVDDNTNNSDLNKKIKEDIELESKKINNKDISNKTNSILKYLREKRTELYVRTGSTDVEFRKKSIKQLDIMQELIEKIESGEKDEKYIENMYGKVQRLKEKEKRLNEESR